MTLTVAVGIGIVAALLLAPHWQRRRALIGITAADPDQRAAAWTWLSHPTDAPRAEALLTDDILPRLDDAGDDALLDAGVNLRKLDLWSPARVPVHLLLRELDLRTASDDVDQHRVALNLMTDMPLDAPADMVIDVFDDLLRSDNDAVRHDAFEAAWLWAGPEHGRRVAALVRDDGDPQLQRLNTIALGWACRLSNAPPPDDLLAPPSAAPADADDELAARWLAWAFAHPHSTHLHDLAEHMDDGDAAAIAEIARFLDEREARPVLRLLADRGIQTAQYALLAMDAPRDQQAARDVVDDPTAERWRRRLAAWRLPSVSRDQLDDLLFIEQTEPPQPVFDVALLAERHDQRDDLTVLAETWMRSMNDDKRRAALLLHTLGYETGYPVHDEVMQADGTYLKPLLFTGPENRSLHLALCTSSEAIGLSTTRSTPADFEPDIALMLLAAGNVDVLQHLTSQPPTGGDHTNIIRRAWLIERFVPFWHEQAGRPVGGSRVALRLHFEALEALRLVTQRRLQFNRQRRVLVYQPASAPPPSPDS